MDGECTGLVKGSEWRFEHRVLVTDTPNPGVSVMRDYPIVIDFNLQNLL